MKWVKIYLTHTVWPSSNGTGVGILGSTASWMCSEKWTISEECFWHLNWSCSVGSGVQQEHGPGDEDEELKWAAGALWLGFERDEDLLFQLVLESNFRKWLAGAGILQDGSFVLCSGLARLWQLRNTQRLWLDVWKGRQHHSGALSQRWELGLRFLSAPVWAKQNSISQRFLPLRKSWASPPVLIYYFKWIIQHTPSYLKFLNASNTLCCATSDIN